MIRLNALGDYFRVKMFEVVEAYTIGFSIRGSHLKKKQCGRVNKLRDKQFFGKR
jgi:hypothetical protein